MIRVETARCRGIKNGQEPHLKIGDWRAQLVPQWPKVQFRTKATGMFNCHGLTFASRRTQINSPAELRKILEDDQYVPVKLTDVQPGDVVLYVGANGDFNHSGIVVEYKDGMVHPLIWSKWGNGPEAVHALLDCPTAYGPNHEFYRCAL